MALINCNECGTEVSKQAVACPKCGNPIKKPATQYGCGTLIVAGILAVVIWNIYSELITPAPTPPPPHAAPEITPTVSPQVTAENDARFDECKKKLKVARDLEVLYALDWKLPKEPHVVVGPTFMDMPIDGKEGFAETLNCFLLAGDSNNLISFDLLHWQTGNSVGRFQYGKLKMK